MFFCSFSIYKYLVLPPLFHTFHPVPLSEGCRILFSMATERYYSKVLSLPHSSTRSFASSVTLPSFSSFSLYVVPSFCRFLSTFVLARFCRYCRCSSRVAAVFSVPRPLRSAFRAFSLLFVRALCLFSVAFWRVAVFSVPRPFCSAFRSCCFVRALCLFFYCFLLYCSTNTESLLYVQQLHERQGHNQDLHRRNQGRRSGGQGLGHPAVPPLLRQAAVTRHHRQHPRHKKKPKELGTTHEQESPKPSAIFPDTFKDF